MTTSEQTSLFSASRFSWPVFRTIQTKSGWTPTLRYVLVQDREALYKMRDLLYCAPEIAWDTETSGLFPQLGARIIGHAFATLTGQDEITAWYIPIRHIGIDNEREAQLDVTEVSTVVDQIVGINYGRCWMQHAKFEWLMGCYDGIRFLRDFEDVSILATINDENEQSFSLKPLMSKYAYDGARDEEAALDDWMRADARALGMPFKKRKRGEEDDEELGEPTYLERFGYARTPIPLCGVYACHDVFGTLYLGLVKFRDVALRFPAVHAREKGVSRILHKMERRGLLADEDEIRATHDKASAEVTYWLAEVRRMVGNDAFHATDDELRSLLYEHLRLPPEKVTKGDKPSVDRESRKLLAKKHPAYAPLLDAVDHLQTARKLKGTYAGNFLRFLSPEKRIHPSYNQLEQREEGGVPVTGRLGSSSPNIQNIAKKPAHLRTCACAGKEDDKCKGTPGSVISIRRYFKVDPGYVRAWLDFGQIELKMLAWLSRDEKLLHAFANDIDVHSVTAREVTGGDRKVAKEVNFGNSFGMTEVGLARRMPGYYDDPEGTRARAKIVLAKFYETYAGIPRFRAEFASQMRRNGNSFVNTFGRPRTIADISAYERWKRERAERMMMSSIVSGTAADLMKESMLRIDAILEEEQAGQIVQSVHDEIVLDLVRGPGWARVLLRCIRAMEAWPQFESDGIPIRVSCDVSTTTWAEKRGLKVVGDTFAWAA